METASRTAVALGAIVVLAALGPAHLDAQTPSATGDGPAASAPRVVRFALGGGAGSMGGSDAISGRAAVTWGRGANRSLTVRATLVEEFELFGPLPVENVWDVGVLYGRERRGRRGYASAAAGIALVGGMRRGDRLSPPSACTANDPVGSLGCWLESLFASVEHEARPFRTVGIPVELEAGLALTRFLGLNANAWAVLNGVRPAGALSVGLVVGKLR